MPTIRVANTEPSSKVSLDARDIVVPVCKARNVERISLAETLLTVFAGSLLSELGLNGHPPGQEAETLEPDDRSLAESRTHAGPTGLGSNIFYKKLCLF
ncbi:hypothetical protein F5Y18DRAFT_431197 [Xylariaceae sp. FL1019]|nr:hypothetical protein F5Y18DRAFT_431197 [Xylariaceae sp. FL1019]